MEGKPHFPATILFISLSLLRASTGVRLLMSSPRISSRIWQSTGSSSWKKLSCIPSRVMFSLSAEGFAIDNGVASLIYEGEELIPQTDIRGVAISGVSRDLGAFEFDGDGSAVDVNKVASAVRVYPNPVGDVMYLTDEAASVKVYSVCGACVAEAYNASSLNVASLPQGVYIVKIEMEDGSVYSNKIQK